MQRGTLLKKIPKICLNIQMIIKNMTLAFLAILSSNLFAANHMIFMGGSGDPEGPKTIFDSTAEMLGKNLQSSNQWKYQVAFNGGHSVTESILATNFSRPVAPTTPFNEQTYKKMIADYKAKIISGTIASGDQLVIVIDTHGAMKTDKSLTHQVAVNSSKKITSTGIKDYNNLSGSETVSLDDLQEIVKLTNEKGIKLGIIDMSCHSGNTLALKQNAPNTCIITSTGPDHYGFAGATTFNGQLWQSLKPGVSLEQAFLEARLNAKDNGYPMISSPTGNEVNNEVYKSMTPYMYYKSPVSDKLTNYVKTNSSDQLICQRENQFNELIAKINELEAAATGTKDGYNGEELKKLITQYKAQQDTMIKTLNQMGASFADTIETFKKNPGSAQELKLSWKVIATSDPDGTIKYFREQMNKAKSAKDKADYQAIIENWNLVKFKKAEILSKYPLLAKIEETNKKLTNQMEDNYNSVFKITVQEKKFYNELYRKKLIGNSSDACAQIVF